MTLAFINQSAPEVTEARASRTEEYQGFSSSGEKVNNVRGSANETGIKKERRKNQPLTNAAGHYRRTAGG